MPRASRKTPLQSPPAAPKAPEAELRVPAHGNGALQVGNPGNKGGTGRPPNALREEMRGDLTDVLGRLRGMVDRMDPSALQRYADFLAKFGVGTQQELSGPDGEPLAPLIVREVRTVEED